MGAILRRRRKKKKKKRSRCEEGGAVVMGMEAMIKREEEQEQKPRELYARLHLAPDAAYEDVERAYREWAQIYHPDKHQTPQMQEIATQNFERILEAYEILSDERKRQVYDLYGMEGLMLGLELGPSLKSTREEEVEEKKIEAFDQQQQQEEQERRKRRRLAVHLQGSLLINLSLTQFLESFKWGSSKATMPTEGTQPVHTVSKENNRIVVPGAGLSMALSRRGMGAGAGSVTVVLQQRISSASSIKLLGVAGLRSLLSIETSRQLSSHSTGTLGLSLSLRDGTVTMANTWSRQLCEGATGTIQLALGPHPGIAVGWQMDGKKNTSSATLKVGQLKFSISGEYVRHFSSKSWGQVSGKLGSRGVEIEIGGESRISKNSSAGLFCVFSLQGISWKVRFICGGQKLVIPILLCTTLNPVIATGALLLLPSIYTFVKVCILRPYYRRRKRQEYVEQKHSAITQVLEARAASEQAQFLLRNVAECRKSSQWKRVGLVIIEAYYGDIKAHLKNVSENGDGFVVGEEKEEPDEADHLPPPYLDVSIPLQFLADDSGQLLLHGGVKKAGLMGFCDPCPGKSKQLRVAYSYQHFQYEVLVGDYDELRIPQEAHKICCSSTLLPCSNRDLYQELPNDSSLQEVEKRVVGEGFDSETAADTNVQDDQNSMQPEYQAHCVIMQSIEKLPNPTLGMTCLKSPDDCGTMLIKFQKKERQVEQTEEEDACDVDTTALLDFLTYGELSTIFSSGMITKEALARVQKIDMYGVLKDISPISFTCHLEEWPAEARRAGLGWTATGLVCDNNIFGVRVDCVQAWLVFLILSYEHRTNTKLQQIAHFKLGIDAHGDHERRGRVCEVIVELLCDDKNHPLSCITLAKWEVGKMANHWDHVTTCIADCKDPLNLMEQLHVVHEDGLDLGEEDEEEDHRHLQVMFIECHHIGFFTSAICNGSRSHGPRDRFCPWCTITRCSQHDVTIEHVICEGDTISSLIKQYHMRSILLLEINPCLQGIAMDDKLIKKLPHMSILIVMNCWPTNRKCSYKPTLGTMSSTTYCARHALIHTVVRMLRKLTTQAQIYNDDIVIKDDSLSHLELRVAIVNPPLSIQCEITDSSAKDSKYKYLKYDDIDESVSQHLLDHHESLLQVMEGLPDPKTFHYTKKMWSSYRAFNKLQQMLEKEDPSSHDQSLAELGNEFLYFATKALGGDVMPYIHIQGAHAAQLQRKLPYAIGRLQNSMCERKKNELRKRHNLMKVDLNESRLDRYGLEMEMRAQYIHLKLVAFPLIQDLSYWVRSWVPWSARSYYKRQFRLARHKGSSLTLETAAQLAETHPPTTANQVLHFFKCWSKKRDKPAFWRKHAPRQSKSSAQQLPNWQSNRVDETSHEVFPDKASSVILHQSGGDTVVSLPKQPHNYFPDHHESICLPRTNLILDNPESKSNNSCRCCCDANNISVKDGSSVALELEETSSIKDAGNCHLLLQKRNYSEIVGIRDSSGYLLDNQESLHSDTMLAHCDNETSQGGDQGNQMSENHAKFEVGYKPNCKPSGSSEEHPQFPPDRMSYHQEESSLKKQEHLQPKEVMMMHGSVLDDDDDDVTSSSPMGRESTLVLNDKISCMSFSSNETEQGRNRSSTNSLPHELALADESSYSKTLEKLRLECSSSAQKQDWQQQERSWHQEVDDPQSTSLPKWNEGVLQLHQGLTRNPSFTSPGSSPIGSVGDETACDYYSPASLLPRASERQSMQQPEKNPGVVIFRRDQEEEEERQQNANLQTDKIGQTFTINNSTFIRDTIRDPTSNPPTVLEDFNFCRVHNQSILSSIGQANNSPSSNAKVQHNNLVYFHGPTDTPPTHKGYNGRRAWQTTTTTLQEHVCHAPSFGGDRTTPLNLQQEAACSSIIPCEHEERANSFLSSFTQQHSSLSSSSSSSSYGQDIQENHINPLHKSSHHHHTTTLVYLPSPSYHPQRRFLSRCNTRKSQQHLSVGRQPLYAQQQQQQFQQFLPQADSYMNQYNKAQQRHETFLYKHQQQQQQQQQQLGAVAVAASAVQDSMNHHPSAQGDL